jgi:hypothetical protein
MLDGFNTNIELTTDNSNYTVERLVNRWSAGDGAGDYNVSGTQEMLL